MDDFDLSRRGFIKVCGAVVALSTVAGARLVDPAFALDQAPRVKLVNRAGRPLKAGALAADTNYVFLYPYVSTPCLLLRLGKATPSNVTRKDAADAAYTWPGGVGKDGTVVAYSAICAHAFSYDSRQTSFLTYNKAKTHLSGHARAITCCAHASVYDPAEGAKVIGGPAKFPLAAVQLVHDPASDELIATGMVGTTLFQDFFKAFRADLNVEYGRGAYREVLRDQTTVLPMDEYSKDVVQC